MTKDETNPNHVIPKNEHQIDLHCLLLGLIRYSEFVIPSFFVIRHSKGGSAFLQRASAELYARP